MEWILVIMMWTTGAHIEHIEGFKTLDSCQKAADKVMGPQYPMNKSAICIERENV